MIFLYVIYSIALFIWTAVSIGTWNAALITYLIGVSLLIFCILMASIILKKSYIVVGMTIMAIMMNLGMSINYRCTYTDFDLKSTYLLDLILMIATFVISYLFVRYTELYRNNKFIYVICSISLLIILVTRLFGKPKNGSYVDVAGIMPFAVVLMTYPFVAAYFMTLKETCYFNGKVKNLSGNLFSFLVYTSLIYLGCCLNNEFGLLLVIGLTSTTLFMINCKFLKTKVFYVTVCVAGALTVMVTKGHIATRIRVWLNPITASNNGELKAAADSQLYLFRHIYSAGWYGNGIGNMSRNNISTMNSDHAILLLINDFSLLIVIALMILSVTLVSWLLVIPKRATKFEKCMNITVVLEIGLILLIDLGSNFASFITAGIGFPYVSDGTLINMMLTGLIAVHCGLIEKRRNFNDKSKEET